METPDENKCGLECIRTNAERICVKPENGQCPRCEQIVEESLGRIRQLESTVSQVSKALCGKENATLDELLKAVDQLKADRVADNNDGRKMPRKVEMALLCLNSQDPTCNLCDYFGESHCSALIGRDIDEHIKQLNSRLAQAERERDAAIHDLHRYCSTCKHDPRKEFNKMPCKLCMDNKVDGYEWRGVCAENSKEESM